MFYAQWKRMDFAKILGRGEIKPEQQSKAIFDILIYQLQ